MPTACEKLRTDEDGACACRHIQYKLGTLEIVEIRVTVIHAPPMEGCIVVVQNYKRNTQPLHEKGPHSNERDQSRECKRATCERYSRDIQKGSTKSTTEWTRMKTWHKGLNIILAGVLAGEQTLFDPVGPKSEHFKHMFSLLGFGSIFFFIMVLAWWANDSHTP